MEPVIQILFYVLDKAIDALGPEKVKAMVDERVALMASLAAEAAEAEKFGKD